MLAPPLLIKAHRWLGLVMSIALLVWAMTGALYSLKPAIQPQPIKHAAPPQTLDLRTAIALPTLLADQGWRSVQQASAVQLDLTLTAYRVKLIGNPIARYYNVMTGQYIVAGESLDAQRLALWYSGQGVDQLTQAQIITTFSDDYPARHRVLPVWQVSFADGLRAYVDPSQSRLISLSNDQQMWLTRLFRIGHTWSLGQIDWPEKKPIMAGYLIGMMLLAIGGISLWMLGRQTNTSFIEPVSMARRWHRRLGSLLAVLLLFWAASGLFHLLRSASPQLIKPSVFLVSHLSGAAWQQAVSQPMARIDLVSLQSSQPDQQTHTGQTAAAWLIRPSTAATESKPTTRDHSVLSQWRMIDAKLGQPLADGLSQRVQHVVGLSTNLKPTQISSVALRPSTEINDHWYSTQIDQRILKIETQTDDHLTLYIDPISSILLAKQNDTDRLESRVFAGLHQWVGLPITQPLRHGLIGIASLLVALLGVLGLILWGMRRYSRQPL